MKHLKWILTPALAASAITPVTIAMTSCSSNFIDYSNIDNYVYIKNAGAQNKYDLVFFMGTSVQEQTQNNGIGWQPSEMKTKGLLNYYTCGLQLGQDCNVFVPLYRQMALSYALGYTSHETLLNDLRTKEPLIDIINFLDYYFTKVNVNAQRPFVLAGHSQGSALLQIVLEKYFIERGHTEYLKNMIAAYSIGYGVSKKWFDGLNQNIIHPATGANDFNCLISWNTEGTDTPQGNNILLPDDENDTYIINPLNWKTDATVATLAENNGTFCEDKYFTIQSNEGIYIPEGYKIVDGKFNAYIDLKRGSIRSTKPDGIEYVKFGEGPTWGGISLHLWDGKGFFMNMYSNLKERVTAFLNSK